MITHEQLQNRFEAIKLCPLAFSQFCKNMPEIVPMMRCKGYIIVSNSTNGKFFVVSPETLNNRFNDIVETLTSSKKN